MNNPTLLTHIVSYMNYCGYKLTRKQGEMNIVAIEGINLDGTLNDDEPNKFNDVIGVFTMGDKDLQWRGLYAATTEPGRYYTELPMNQRGAARLAFGQYKSWQVGWHNGDHKALVQSGGSVTVHRDKNQDFIRSGDYEDTGYFGINIHWGWNMPIDNIGKTSAGCIVIPEWRDFQSFMQDVESDQRYIGNNNHIFSVTILPGDKVLAHGRKQLQKR
jgi:hypothetical protein